jgi:hypothetical protein
MKPKNSPLQQTQFVVLDSSIKLYVPDNASEIDLSKIPVTMDFDLLENENNDPHTLRIVLSITGNESDQVPGYIFNLTVGGEYSLSNNIEPGSDEYKAYVKNSALACLINESRVFLQTISSFLPFGSYIMPMVDLNDLLLQKSNHIAHGQDGSRP